MQQSGKIVRILFPVGQLEFWTHEIVYIRGRSGCRVGSGWVRRFCRKSWVGSGQRSAGSGWIGSKKSDHWTTLCEIRRKTLYGLDEYRTGIRITNVILVEVWILVLTAPSIYTAKPKYYQRRGCQYRIENQEFRRKNNRWGVYMLCQLYNVRYEFHVVVFNASFFINNASLFGRYKMVTDGSQSVLNSSS